ncbi:MAG: hypothetical protein WAK71_13270 [Streptosporangiaceae bacterium]|jgi:hypothetical protein
MANQTVIGTFRVRAEAEGDFRSLLRRHWPTLHELGFVTDEPSVIYRGHDGGLTYVEIFTWAEGGYEHAREHPAVLAIWGPMDPLLEERDGGPKWDFPHYERVTLAT